MRSESQKTSGPANAGTATPADGASVDRHLVLVRRRSILEAKLLAHRCGWLTLDEIRQRRLERSLRSVLSALGKKDPADRLIRHRKR